MSIFISHSSKDKFIVDQFVEKILILGCGLIDDNIFCTSVEGLGIKTGYDFREHIKNSLVESDYAFLMISENYKKSEVCLNEMGAAWASRELKVKQFLFPNLGFESLGLLLNIQQAARLEDQHTLDELFEELTSIYKTEKKVSRWNKHKHDFLEFVKQYKNEQSNKKIPSPEEFFGKFILENVSLNHLLMKAHPTLLDCKVIFSKDYYRYFFESYCLIFENLEKDIIEPLYPKRKYFRFEKTDTMELITGVNKIAGGLVGAAQKGYFNQSIEFYKVTFLEKMDDDGGISFKVFCYVNDRWVFLLRPYQFFEK